MSKRNCPDMENRSSAVLLAQAKYRANVGALLFLYRCTMPMISFAVGRLGRFASNSGPEHQAEMTHLLRYINGVRDMGLRYSRDALADGAEKSLPQCQLYNYNKDKADFKCYTDSDFAGCVDSSRSTSGGVITWMGAAICWNSNLQSCVTLSTAEAEMVAMRKAAHECIWLRRYMKYLFGENSLDGKPTKIYCDNQATLQLVDNRIHHSRTKHIRLRGNFVREYKDLGELDPVYVATKMNIADGFTKPIKKDTIESHSFELTGMKMKYAEKPANQ